MFLIRLCSAVLSAYVFTLFIPSPSFLMWKLSYCTEYWDAACDEDFIWYSKLTMAFKVFNISVWILAWLTLEIISSTRPERPKSRLLTHLRYGPIAVLLLSIGTILISDMMLIQFSRWRIVSYIQSDAPPLERPELKLHTNYRGFCGNGVSAHMYALYGSTPAEYVGDPDPAVRARALHASIYVYDGWNNSADGTMNILKRAANDPDLMVRTIARKYQTELFGLSPPGDGAALLKN